MATNPKKPNNLLRQQRLQRSWTLERAADELYKLCGPRARARGDINANMISRWELGKHPPSPFWQEKLCTLYKKTTKELGFLEEQQASLNQQTTLLSAEDSSSIIATQPTFITMPQGLLKEHTNLTGTDTHLAFLEASMKNQWTLYHTAGALHAYQGLDLWMQEIINCARALRGTIWHERIHSLLAMSYQLQSCILRDLMQYPQAYQAHRKAYLIAQAIVRS
jgi:transcriptional regulator with XRE-family HTH domain